VCEKPHLVIRSIDLGIEETIRTTAELEAGERLGSGFGIARAAFRLAGFDPRFHAAGGADLSRLLSREFGGGIELSMLAAIPKGSGLGTSSILSATILGTGIEGRIEKRSNDRIVITGLPSSPPDPHDTVIKLVLDGKPEASWQPPETPLT